ncbi:MAG: FGGY family carbohydrate kinase [Tetrasphaera sp.]
MGRSLLAGIDAGTTSIKALLLTPDGTEVALGRAPTRWEATQFGAETSAEHVRDAALAALADALRQCPEDRIAAVGVASMAESGVLTDDSDTPLGPVIAWHDHRDEAELADLIATIGGDRFCATTGLPLWTLWSLTKYRWLTTHLPQVRETTRRYHVAEWIVRSLGGERASELSLASRTGWLDLHRATAWPESLEWSGAPRFVLADLVSAGTPLGRAATTGDLAALNGAVLTVAGHDHQVAAVALGCHRPGAEFDSCGTAEALCRTAQPGLAQDVVLQLTRRGVTVGWHAAPNRWCLLGATQGGLLLGKVMSALGVEPGVLAQLDRAAATAPDRPGAVTLGPTASDITIDAQATPGEVWRAATRAVTRQATELAAALSAASGPRSSLSVAGGWTHSAALMTAKSAGAEHLRLADTPEAGCRGAAIFAGLAAGAYASLDEAPTV